jgi:hypothetical protein
MLPFERKASPSCTGGATIVNGRISCVAWLVSRRNSSTTSARRSALRWIRRILDPSRSGGRRKVRPDRIFGPQPTRRLCDECDAGRGLDTHDQAADRSRLRCHAFALHQGGRAFPWERRRHSPLTARITVRLRQIGVPTCSDVAIAQKAIIGCWAKPIQPAYPVNCSSLDAF